MIFPNITDFKNLFMESLGPEIAGDFFSYLEESGGDDRTLSVRFKNKEEDYCGLPVDCAVPWTEKGYYLSRRPSFTLDPLFHCGAYYPQDASSMFPELLSSFINFSDPHTVLDLCAAPGGKSTHIVSLLGSDSLLVSNEIAGGRASVLADNMAKWGAPNVIVSSSDALCFGKNLPGIFDIVFVDAPCSGEGMFRKIPAAASGWSINNVRLCSTRQRRILADVWPAVSEGGYLIYSTCTFNHLENDDNISFCVNELGAECLSLPTGAGSSGIEGNGILRTRSGGHLFIPGRVRGEGQYFAVLRKKSADNVVSKTHGNSCYKSRARKKIVSGGGSGCGFSPKGFKTILAGSLLKAYPSNLADMMLYVEKNIKVISSGLAVAIKKGTDFIPHPDYALSDYINETLLSDSVPFPVHELSLVEALTFLKKEPLVFPKMPLGFILLTYRGHGLGFVKNLGKRSNNLLSNSRRIRMDIPDEPEYM